MSGLSRAEHEELAARFPVNMDLVAAKALADMVKRWHLEFDCGGVPFIWDGEAATETEAIALGRKAIYMDGRFDETARVAICLERSK